MLDEILTRMAPTATPDLTLTRLAVVCAVALGVVLVPPVWRVARLAVTLVHELGHAFAGVLCGRRFTGFVLRADMSGHAVTVGKPRGLGLVVTTWAGYPAPALVAAAAVWLVTAGYAAPLLTAGLIALLVAVPRIRSGLTALVLLGALAALGALWWWGTPTLQVEVLVALALVLLVGAWRHLGAVAASRDRASDPAMLAQLTVLPRPVWILSFAAVLAASTWAVWRLIAT